MRLFKGQCADRMQMIRFELRFDQIIKSKIKFKFKFTYECDRKSLVHPININTTRLEIESISFEVFEALMNLNSIGTYYWVKIGIPY